MDDPVNLEDDPGGWFTPYQPLPGTPVGPHDSIELTGDPALIESDPDIGLLDGVTWWHHADKPPAGKRPKGGRCGGGNLSAHDLTPGSATVEDLTGIDISPSLLCSMCGRHIFVKGGEVRDLGNAHLEAPSE